MIFCEVHSGTLELGTYCKTDLSQNLVFETKARQYTRHSTPLRYGRLWNRQDMSSLRAVNSTQ